MNLEPPSIIDPSFRNLFDKSAKIIHDQEDPDRAHETLEQHFSHIGKGNSRTVYQIPPVHSGEDRLVVKFALPNVGGSATDDPLYPIEYTAGWAANWHEIILTNSEILDGIILPVLDHHSDGLWVAMPYAETLPQSPETMRHLDPLVDEIEESNVEFASHGESTGQPEIYQINAWGLHRGEYRLRDYGGIVVSDEDVLKQLPYPWSEHRIQ